MKKLFLVLAIVTLVAVGAFAADMYTTADVNVRKGPSAEYDLVGTLKKGTSVQVIDASGAWYRIKSGNVEGYVNSSYLSGSGSSSSGSSDVKNYISGEVHFFGAGVRYERMLTDRMSIGANVYYKYMGFFDSWFLGKNEFEAGGSFRFYITPMFFVGSGLGFHLHQGWYDYDYGWGITGTWWGNLYGVSISPDVGMKIDFGDKGGFFLQPGIKIPITFGVRDEYYYNYLYGTDSTFGVAFDILPYFGLGFAF